MLTGSHRGCQDVSEALRPCQVGCDSYFSSLADSILFCSDPNLIRQLITYSNLTFQVVSDPGSFSELAIILKL